MPEMTLSQIREACEKATANKLTVANRGPHTAVTASIPEWDNGEEVTDIAGFLFETDARFFVMARTELPRLCGVLAEIVEVYTHCWRYRNPEICQTAGGEDDFPTPCEALPVCDILRDAGVRA